MLKIISIVSLRAGAASSLIILYDILAGHKQQMWIMNVVWPITGLYAGPLGLGADYMLGHLSMQKKTREAKARGESLPERENHSGKALPLVSRTAVAAVRLEIW